jgi:hypothetical protein
MNQLFHKPEENNLMMEKLVVPWTFLSNVTMPYGMCCKGDHSQPYHIKLELFILCKIQYTPFITHTLLIHIHNYSEQVRYFLENAFKATVIIFHLLS